MQNLKILKITSFLRGLLFPLPVLALYYAQSLGYLGGDITKYVALIFAIEALSFAITEIPSGVFSDLLGRKKTIILAHLAATISLILFYFAGFQSEFNFAILAIYAFFSALGRSLLSGTDSAMIYDTLKDKNQESEFKKQIGKYYAQWPLGAAIACIIGVYMIEIFSNPQSETLNFAITALFTLIPLIIATILTFFLQEPKFHKSEDHNPFRHFWHSLKIIFQKHTLFILALGFFIFVGIEEAIHQLKPIFFSFKDLSIIEIGYFSAAIYGFSFIGKYNSASISDKLGDKWTLIMCLTAMPLLIILATFLPPFWAATSIASGSIFFGIKMPVIDNVINHQVDSQKRATIISTINFTGQFGLAIIAPIIGAAADLYDINTAFRISALITLIVPVIFLKLKE